MSICVPQEAEAWITRHEECSAANAESARRRIEAQICSAARRHLAAVCLHPPASAQVDIYAGRVWRALEYHWKRLGESQPLPFQRLLDRAEAADLGIGTGKASLVYEVILAQALECNESKAAEMFEVQYMPDIRTIARRVAGQWGLDLTENFAAELIVSGEGRMPKISKYHGRTFLSFWLRSVVCNHCVSAARKSKPESLISEPAGGAAEMPLEILADRAECQKLLRPLFKAALESLAAQDCALVKMLSLDGVPQNRVARSLGIHSGNVTRRRQKATEGIFSRLRELVRGQQQENHFESCIQSALAGDDPVLRDWLGRLLGTILSSRSQNQQPGGQS